MDDDAYAIVADIGSGTTKIGFAGDDAPSAVFDTIYGTYNNIPIMASDWYQNHVIGEEAQSKRGILTLSKPVQRGIVVDWDQYQDFLCHTFSSSLRNSNPEEHNMLLSEPAHNPKLNREKQAELLFETFRVPAMALCNSGVLALYASGRTCGLVLDIGEGVSQSIPIYSGYCLESAVQRQDLGGADQTDFLAKIFSQRGYYFTTTSEYQIVREIKEKLSYVAKDFEEDLNSAQCSSELERSYELADKQVIALSNERFRCTETLFNPSMLGAELPGVHTMVYESIMRTSVDLRKDLFGNIVISGGPTLSPGFAERLQTEVSWLAPTTMKIRVVAPPERKYSVWIGGSILGSLSVFNGWVSRAEYDEIGVTALHEKSLATI